MAQDLCGSDSEDEGYTTPPIKVKPIEVKTDDSSGDESESDDSDLEVMGAYSQLGRY